MTTVSTKHTGGSTVAVYNSTAMRCRVPLLSVPAHRPRAQTCRALPLLALVLVLSAVFGCAKKNLVFDESSRPVIAAENVVVCTARSQIGTRYKNGGASPDTGFDCSGFVAWVYGRHGVSIPRTTEAQAQAGRAVPPSRMRPGDLVVFIISRQQGMHTGIYSGDGKFIHSPSSGKSVREESVHSSYWKQRLLSARRILR